MINFHKPTASGFTAGILLIGVMALSGPASAGHGSVTNPPGVARRRPFFWKAPQLAGRSKVVALSPTSRSPVLPVKSLAIVECGFALRVRHCA
jgi:hypothetical protein